MADSDQPSAGPPDWDIYSNEGLESVTLVAELGPRKVTVELFRPIGRADLAEGLRFLASKL